MSDPPPSTPDRALLPYTARPGGIERAAQAPGAERMHEILADLNEPQRQAVTHRDGPLLVLAGPGSGKTRVITRRAAWLVHSGVPPQAILAITFTNKAADEMKRRIQALGVARGMWVHTFHALGARLLREFGPLARVESGFVIYDEDDRLRTVREAMERAGISPDLVKAEGVVSAISQAKNLLWSPAEYARRAEFFDQRAIARVYAVYETLLEQRNAVDFDDLLMRVALVLRDHDEWARRLGQRFRYVLIDEYQDTNFAQYLIARLLGAQHRNICATGDPDQSIYGWRGADIGNILRFEQDWPDARVVRLEQNYRSTPQILAVADQVIAANRRRKPKELWTANAEGPPVQVWEFNEGRDEAERIAEFIQEQARSGRPYSDFALLYRINALSRSLEEALRARAIPYRMVRGVEFYARKEIKDVVAYLRVLVNPADDVSLLRILNEPPRGIGRATVERLMHLATERKLTLAQALADVGAGRIDAPALRSALPRLRAFLHLLDALRPAVNLPAPEAVAQVLALSGLEATLREEQELGGEDRLANVQELVSAAARYHEEADNPTVPDFLNRISLTSDQDALDEHAGSVLLMTLHAAKGLEFPIVIITGLEQGMLPHERVLRERGGTTDIEEERRLFFVGITRARERLIITHSQQRVLRGQLTPLAPSEFLRQVPATGVEWTSFRQPAPTPGAAQTIGSHAPPAHSLHEPLEEEFDGPRRWRQRRTTPPGSFEECSTPPPVDADPHADPRTAATDPPALLSAPMPRRRRGRHLRFARHSDEPVFSPDDPTRPPLTSEPPSPFADWSPGTLVRHARYGVGQLIWIRPAPGQTRASIRFAGYGEKTFILELAPVEKLQRSAPDGSA